MFTNRPTAYDKGRSAFIRHEVVNIYPDTLVWNHDFTYSFNEPMTNNYFCHTAYDHYPVVGVSWVQAKAFCNWRTKLRNVYLRSEGLATEEEFRLPSEMEWEYASRGGLAQNPYPWGGPYTSNKNGCFLANFKPQRGAYELDGALYPCIVAHYHPNDFGLYDMAGNVAEWCEDAYDESAYNFAHDFNMQYTFTARDEDPIRNKRKTIRGGSWKDISHYIQLTSRSYEYQDTAKSYIGFRCVQSYIGRHRDDNNGTASHIY